LRGENDLKQSIEFQAMPNVGSKQSDYGGFKNEELSVTVAKGPN